jgi:NAD(P) transhydrogenase subunit alpha
MVEHKGVKIVGHLNVPGRLAATASAAVCAQSVRLHRNADRQGSKAIAVDWDDELVQATLLTRDGALVNPMFEKAA